MVQPPENAGMEFPDFDKMTPEEQMAWLESLARRQGASDEEFTTAADLEIAVPENAVIDEPGYVPFFERERGSSAPREDAPAQEPVDHGRPAPEPEIPAQPEAPALAEPHVPELVENADLAELEAADPMRWLDSFTPHSEDVFGDLELDLDFEPDALEEFDLGELERLDLEPPQPAQPPAPQPTELELAAPGTPEAAESDAELESISGFDFDALLGEIDAAAQPAPETLDDEFLSGIDPMRWLESLAVRQGVPSEELTTAADLEIPEVPEDTVIDEPGYVPYDATDGTREPDSVRRLVSESDALNEPLAAPGAGDAELPGAEQDYAVYSPTESAAHEMASAAPSDAPDQLGDELAGSLSWLDDLTGTPETEDFAAMLDLEQDILGVRAPGDRDVEQPQTAVQTGALAEDPLAGLTDEEILNLQVRGELTGAQELVWLQRQAEKLAEARQLEASGAELPADALEAAEPAVLPDWLEEMRDEAGQAEVEAAEVPEEAFFEAGILEGLPDWLTQPEALPAAGSDAGTELSTLWGEEPATEASLEEPIEVSASEVDMFLSEQYAAGPDSLADALDAEYERRLAGDDSEPDWYREAVAENAEAVSELEAGQVGADGESAPDLQPAMPVDLPDWLKDSAETEDSEPAAAASVWPAEPEAGPDRAEVDAVPDWLEAPVEKADRAERAPEPEAPAVLRDVPIPASPQFEQYRERLGHDPADHASRLSLARALKASGEAVTSLDHYEVLVESSALLPDVSEDLNTLASQQQDDTRVHRLRGDTYMRRGMLQEALDAYRTALEQL